MQAEKSDSPLIGADDLEFARETYTRIAFIRAFEAKALALSKADPPAVIGSIHLCAGQEAVPLGALAGLRNDDQVLATYRGHGWALASGLDPLAVMAEICHRKGGINGGRGGSAYMMAPDTRFIGENSIVGAGTTIACGVALANLAEGKGRMVIVSIGDGAMNQGSVHEALAFSATFRLPIIFVCENNGWSELTPTRAMFRIERLAQRAGPYGITGATINGTDPFIVRDTIVQAATRVRSGGGPVLIECLVPRLWGHYNRDIEHYREKADRMEAAARDPLVLLGERLVASGGVSTDDLDSLRREQEKAVETIASQVLASPLADVNSVLEHVTGTSQSTPSESANRAYQTTQELTYAEAAHAALRAVLSSDPKSVIYGEDVGKPGGIFGVTRNLQNDFGPERVFDTPISENAILGSAVGAAISGLKPIVEIMWADFIFVALDQLINQAANIRYVTQGRTTVPLVVRMQQGSTPGSCSQHSQCIEAILAHIPGLKVALAATPQDAYSLLRAAAADPDPCVVIEARALYPSKGLVDTSIVEPVGKARVHRRGRDLAIVTWGTMVPQSIAAAAELEKQGYSVSVVDLRWLAPLDDAVLLDIAQTSGGKVLIVHEAVQRGGYGAEIAMHIRELCGPGANLSVHRLATPSVRIPASPVLRAALLPNSDSIARAVRGLLNAD
jgi:2-oxoisovalerate dehydrogenase E1 component